MKRTIMFTVVALSLTLGSTGAYANARISARTSDPWLQLASVPGPPIPDPWLQLASVPGPPIPDPWLELTVTSNNAVWGTAR